jgi:hypothetical protein
MSHQWPAETAFRRMDLYVRDQACTFYEADRRWETLKGTLMLFSYGRPGLRIPRFFFPVVTTL